MNLYWHKFEHRDHVLYVLCTEPLDQNRPKPPPEITCASVVRSNGRWRYDIKPLGSMPSTWGLTGSPIRYRRLVEEHLSRKSIAAFGEDRLDFTAA